MRRALLLVFCMFFVFSIPVKASERLLDVRIPVKQIFDTKQEKLEAQALEGIYEFSTRQEDAPMPEGSVNGIYNFSITGTQVSANIAISYEHAGVYSYSLRQITEEKEGYHYDRGVYEVTVYVKNGEENQLLYEIVAKQNSHEKSSELIFANAYDNPQKPSVTPESTHQGKPDGVKTGDQARVEDYIVASLGAVVMLFFLLEKKREKAKR